MIRFMTTAIRRFFQVGALFPSTRWVGRSIAAKIPPDTHFLVEFGPGDGAVSEFLLTRLAAGGTLTAVEINSEFAAQLAASMHDHRFRVVQSDVQQFIQEQPARSINAIVSGIPFSFLGSERGAALVRACAAALKDGGCLVIYQHSKLVLPWLRLNFHEVTQTLEVRNFPPYFVFAARRPKRL